LRFSRRWISRLRSAVSIFCDVMSWSLILLDRYVEGQQVLPKRWYLSTKLYGKSQKSQPRFYSSCFTLAPFISYCMYPCFYVFSDILQDALLCGIRRGMAKRWREW
jgi:hypothetical protein